MMLYFCHVLKDFNSNADLYAIQSGNTGFGIKPIFQALKNNSKGNTKCPFVLFLSGEQRQLPFG